MPKWLEQEEDQLCDDLNAGRITRKQFDDAMRDMRATMHDIARQASEDAYERTMGEF